MASRLGAVARIAIHGVGGSGSGSAGLASRCCRLGRCRLARDQVRLRGPADRTGPFRGRRPGRSLRPHPDLGAPVRSLGFGVRLGIAERRHRRLLPRVRAKIEGHVCERAGRRGQRQQHRDLRPAIDRGAPLVAEPDPPRAQDRRPVGVRFPGQRRDIIEHIGEQRPVGDGSQLDLRLVTILPRSRLSAATTAGNPSSWKAVSA